MLSESDMEDELFDLDPNMLSLRKRPSAIPEYIKNPEFEKFTKKHSFRYNPDIGIICLLLNRDFYFPGQLVRGRCYIHLYRTMPASQIVIRLDAKEYGAGIHSKKFLETIKRRKTVVR